MRPRYFVAFLSALSGLFLAACETTTDYGYPVSAFNDDTIVQLFALSDDAIARRDFPAYKSFFAPGYVAVDSTRRSQGTRGYTNRLDYLDMVESIFDTAKHLEVNTMVMDIDYSEDGQSALVRVQEEEKRIQFGNTQHYTSLLDVEVGFENGWIFITKSTRTAMQVIEE